MNTNQKLYRILAKFGANSDTYYVVAPGPTAAQEAVEKLHRDRKWMDVDSASIEQIAEADPYGKPSPLILS